MGKWKFDPNIDYQRDAINAVLNLFEGQDKISDNNANRFYRNELNIPRSRIAENLMKIKKNPVNNVGYWDDELLPDNKFTIEMETGTGKTYVYLRTILELYIKYGFSKFILVVPSIPIRMGVEKTIMQLRNHFMNLYDGLDITHCYFVYDSKKTLHKLDAFTQLGGLKIAIMNYQAFDKSTNILKKGMKDENGKIQVEGNENGKVYWEELRKTNPIVIIDEPQKIIGTTKRKSNALKSIEELKPMATFMYSATHTNYYNLIYKLDSFDAFKKHLVKQIRVSTIYSDIDKNYPYFRYLKFNKDLSATVELLKNESNGVKVRQVKIDRPCDLYEITGLDQYKGFKILNAPHKYNGINTNFYKEVINEQYAFSEGESNYKLYEDEMAKIQMKITIKKHLDKQIEMLKENVKVLSLFFIDEVSKYRNYNNSNAKGIYAKMFEELYTEIINSDVRYIDLIKKMPSLANASKVHEGYFAIDKNKKVLMDEKTYTSTSEKSMEDIQRGIKKILDGKEKLIQLDEPISFIFAHSALSEGWDNPNVFQLCFLRQTKSEIRKKQEIGRGLRLARGSGEDSEIKRDENINQLTVIANENYEEFAKSLQEEFNEENKYNREAITIEDTKQIQLVIENKIDKSLSNDFFKKLHQELISGGFLKVKDNTMNKNKIAKLKEYQFLDDELNENKDRIVDALKEVMQEKESNIVEKYLINDDEVVQNNWQKYVTDSDFQKMISELEDKLNKKTIYQVCYDEKDLIYNIIVSASQSIKSFDQEVIEKSGILQGDDRQKGVTIQEESSKYHIHKIEEKLPITKSFVDIINYIVNKTNFTRKSIIKIITQLRNPSLLQRQDNVDILVKIIEEQKKVQCYKNRESIQYTVIDEDNNLSASNMFLVNEVLATKIGKTVFETKESNRRGLCKYFTTDSEGEYIFAQRLEEDDDVLMYSKLKKGSIIIENPIENYSPDWAVVCKVNDKNIRIYLIVETKWDKNWEDLSQKEQTKIVCAQKHFEAVNNNIKYGVVNKLSISNDFSNGYVYSWDNLKKKFLKLEND